MRAVRAVRVRVFCVTQGIFFTLVGNCNEAMAGPERLTKEELTDAFASHFEVLSIYETRCVQTFDAATETRDLG